VNRPVIDIPFFREFTKSLRTYLRAKKAPFRYSFFLSFLLQCLAIVLDVTPLKMSPPACTYCCLISLLLVITNSSFLLPNLHFHRKLIWVCFPSLTGSVFQQETIGISPPVVPPSFLASWRTTWNGRDRSSFDLQHDAVPPLVKKRGPSHVPFSSLRKTVVPPLSRVF